MGVRYDRISPLWSQQTIDVVYPMSLGAWSTTLSKVLNNLCIEPNLCFHLHYPPPKSLNPAPVLHKS